MSPLEHHSKYNASRTNLEEKDMSVKDKQVSMTQPFELEACPYVNFVATELKDKSFIVH